MDRHRGSRKLTYVLFLVLFLVLAALVLRQVAETHLRAAAVLTLLNDPNAHGMIADFARRPFTEQSGSALVAEGPMKFRLYIPKGGARNGGIVLLHGVHHLGMDDPRLVDPSVLRALSAPVGARPSQRDRDDHSLIPCHGRSIVVPVRVLT